MINAEIIGSGSVIRGAVFFAVSGGWRFFGDHTFIILKKNSVRWSLQVIKLAGFNRPAQKPDSYRKQHNR
jgi:hypothetical protein